MRFPLFLAALAVFLAAALLPLLSGCSQSYADRVVSVGQNELTVIDAWNDLNKTHEVAPDAEVVIDGEPANLQDIQPGDAVRVTTELQDGQEVAVKIDADRAEAEDAAEGSGGIDVPLSPPGLSPLPGDFQEQPMLPQDPAASPGEQDKPAEPKKDEPAKLDAGKPAEEPEPSRNEPTTAARPEEGAESIFRGEIDNSRPNLLRILAEADKGLPATEMTFTVTEETEILLAGKPASAEDLSEGMVVTVIATKQGDQVVARRIEAEPMPA